MCGCPGLVGSLRLALHRFLQLFSMLAWLVPLVCGCIGLVGSLGVWLYWIGWPLHCIFRMAWRGWLNFILLPVVGFFLMIGWFPHVLHATGSIGLAILAWFMQTWWVGSAWSSFGNSCMVHAILASALLWLLLCSGCVGVFDWLPLLR